MKRLLIGIALFAGACAADTAPTAPATKQDPVEPKVAPVAARSANPADAWRGASGLQTTSVNTGAAVAPVGPGAAANPRPGTAAPITTDAGQAIPADAHFTIYCDSFTSPDHVAEATAMKKVLMANSKLKDWYVVHQDGQSTLYHGFYREFDPKIVEANAASKRDALRAQQDKSMVDLLPDPRAIDRKLFPKSLIVPLDAPDPVAPPAWNLANAKGYWSVQVAAFTVPERKMAAVEAVREARKQGIEAYYFHGDSVSSVCIGAWPKAAVRSPQHMEGTGELGVDRGANEDSDLVINYNSQPLPDSYKNRIGPDGKPMRILETKQEVVDPTLMATLRTYPAHAVNNAEQMLDATHARPSFMVEIPRPATAADAPVDVNAPPRGARPDLTNRLRGIGR